MLAPSRRAGRWRSQALNPGPSTPKAMHFHFLMFYLALGELGDG